MLTLVQTGPDIGAAAVWMEVLGRAHVLAIHFPIALIMTAALIEIAATAVTLLRRDTNGVPHPSRAATVCIVLGALSAAFATWSGWTFARHEWDTPTAAVNLHRWMGVAATATALLAAAALVLAQVVRRYVVVGAARGLLVVAAIVVAVAGHFGGTLVHGSNHLFAPLLRGDEPAPPVEPARDPVGREPGPAAPAPGDELPHVTFADDVMPIFESRCLPCHGAERAKGGFSFQIVPSLLGALEPGDPDGSTIVQRISLPADHEDRMPPKKDPLTPEQVAVIVAWIAHGAALADTTETAAPVAVEPEPEPAPAPEPEPEPAPAPEPDPEPEPAPAFPQLDDEAAALRDVAIAALVERGARASVIAADADAVEVSFKGVEDAGDDELDLLDDLESCLVWLDLSGTDVTDEGVERLAGFTTLRRVVLAETAVTDAAMPVLVGLPMLEVLNLRATGVTDDGIQELIAAPALARVYLWQTLVTPEGAAWLRAVKPDLEIELGAAPTPPAEPPPAEQP